MRSMITALIAAAVLGAPAAAQNLCPCVPITHQWTVTTCDSWNCASSALVLANGDPGTFAVPVGIDDSRWLVVRRISSGTGTLPKTDDPFQIEAFDGMTDASSRFLAMVPETRPMLMTSPDGHVLLISLKVPEPRRRPAGK